MSSWVLLLLVVVAATGYLGAWVASQRGREPLEGAILGVVFSGLGVLVEALLPVGEPTQHHVGLSDASAGPGLPIPMPPDASDQSEAAPPRFYHRKR